MILLILPWGKGKHDALYSHRSKKFSQNGTNAFCDYTLNVFLCTWRQGERLASTLGLHQDKTLAQSHMHVRPGTNSYFIYHHPIKQIQQYLAYRIFYDEFGINNLIRKDFDALVEALYTNLKNAHS